MSEELKPCPFCGGRAELVQFTRKRWSVECFADGCGSSIISCADKQAAIDSWNTRATHPAPESVGGVEVVKVVGHLSHCADLYDPDAPPPPPQEPLMTVAQHNRIMAATVPAGSRVVPVELLERAMKTIDKHWPKSIALRELRALLEVKP